MNAVGKNIKKLRIASKMTQEDLAEKMFVTRQTISNWEIGKSQPDLETLSAISEIFSVEPTELIYGMQPSYKRYQKKYIITAVISLCVIIAVILLECIYYPQLMDIYRQFYRGAFELMLYNLTVRPLGFFALGIFVVSFFSLWVETRLDKKPRIVTLIIGIILLVLPIWLLIEMILIFKAPQVFQGSIFYSSVFLQPILRTIFLVVMPLLSGIGIFLGWERK